jgi:hypothetical protein
MGNFMLVRASTYKANASRYHGPSPVAIMVILAAIYVGVAGCFYWLMQPTVVKNSGVAAYKPPAATVISSTPWVPPESSAPIVAQSEPADLPEAAAPKKDPAKREARTTAPRQERARDPMLDYASSQRRPQSGWGQQGSWGSQQGSWGWGQRPQQGYGSQQGYASQGSRPWF